MVSEGLGAGAGAPRQLPSFLLQTKAQPAQGPLPAAGVSPRPARPCLQRVPGEGAVINSLSAGLVGACSREASLEDGVSFPVRHAEPGRSWLRRPLRAHTTSPAPTPLGSWGSTWAWVWGVLVLVCLTEQPRSAQVGARRGSAPSCPGGAVGAVAHPAPRQPRAACFLRLPGGPAWPWAGDPHPSFSSRREDGSCGFCRRAWCEGVIPGSGGQALPRDTRSHAPWRVRVRSSQGGASSSKIRGSP